MRGLLHRARRARRPRGPAGRPAGRRPPPRPRHQARPRRHRARGRRRRAAGARVRRFDAIRATEAGLREGIFFAQALSGRPDRCFDDVRRARRAEPRAAVRPARRTPGTSPRLALSLFDELAAAGLHPAIRTSATCSGPPRACHDVGVAVDYDDHHKHSRYLILSAGLPGFSPREVALIAQPSATTAGHAGPGRSPPCCAGRRRLLDRCRGPAAARGGPRAQPRPGGAPRGARRTGDRPARPRRRRGSARPGRWAASREADGLRPRLRARAESPRWSSRRARPGRTTTGHDRGLLARDGVRDLVLDPEGGTVALDAHALGRHALRRR